MNCLETASLPGLVGLGAGEAGIETSPHTAPET